MPCPSSIQCWDLNPQPHKHELSPITTRPGLQPKMNHFMYSTFERLSKMSRVKFGAFGNCYSEKILLVTKAMELFS